MSLLSRARSGIASVAVRWEAADGHNRGGFSRPMKQLRTFPVLQTRDIITLTVQFMTELPSGLYEQVVRHPWDDTLMLD